MSKTITLNLTPNDVAMIHRLIAFGMVGVRSQYKEQVNTMPESCLVLFDLAEKVTHCMNVHGVLELQTRVLPELRKLEIELLNSVTPNYSLCREAGGVA